MGWRDFLQPPDLVEKKEKKEKTPAEIEKIPFIPFIPSGRGSENPNLTLMGHLDETSQEAFKEYVNLMTGPKFKMPLEQAQLEASQLVLRNLRTLQIQQATKEYRKQGWIKIFSTTLSRAIYLVKDQAALRCAPDQDIPIYIESDLEALNGLAPEEARVLLEARILFGGPIKVEDYSERPHKRKVDGKQIARNFYGKDKQ